MRQTINELTNEFVEFLQKLVQIPSPFGAEAAAQKLVESKMREIGVQPKIFYSRGDTQSVNLVAVVEGLHSKRYPSLILNAHCDTAPVDSPELWSFEPYCGDIKDGKLLGRGSLDDKAGIAVMLLLAKLFLMGEFRLKGDLIIQSVIEDESSGNGTKTLTQNGYIANGAIIIDGTWDKRIIYGHWGQLWIDATFYGLSVAACVMQRGVNPIFEATKFCGLLKEELQNRFGGECFVNLGKIESGIWEGSVPAKAEAKYQIGYLGDAMPGDIFDIARRCASMLDVRTELKKGMLQTPPFSVDEEGVFVSYLAKIVMEELGECLLQKVSGHCDMRHFGTQNALLYGPGGGKNPHGIDEYYLVEMMPRVAYNIARFAKEFTGRPVV